MAKKKVAIKTVSDRQAIVGALLEAGKALTAVELVKLIDNRQFKIEKVTNILNRFKHDDGTLCVRSSTCQGATAAFWRHASVELPRGHIDHERLPSKILDPDTVKQLLEEQANVNKQHAGQRPWAPPPPAPTPVAVAAPTPAPVTPTAPEQSSYARWRIPMEVAIRIADLAILAVVDNGLGRSTFRDMYPDAYNELMKYRVDMRQDILEAVRSVRL